jgi:hypothetical protein
MTRHSDVYIRQKAVAAYQLSRCLSKTAKRVGKSTSYVSKWVQRFNSMGHVNDLPHKGRICAISKAAVRRSQALLLSTQSLRLTTRKLKAERLIPKSMSHTTIWRHLMDGKTPVKHRGIRRQPLITPTTAGKRIKFAEYHAKTNWCKVLYVDSKYFCVCNDVSSKQWVPADVIPTRTMVKHSPAIHVYAGFSARGATALIEASGTTGFRFLAGERRTRGVCAAEYQHVLTQHLIPAARKQFGKGKWLLLQDGAPPHKAASTTALLAEQRVQLVQHWPGNSPDLNPIENLWSWVSRRMQARPITTQAQLRTELKAAWRAIPKALLKALASSMKQRLALVKANKGQYIKH